VAGDYLEPGFYYSADGRAWRALKENVDGVPLSPAFLKGYNYTGVYVGLCASSNGTASENHADFEPFDYRPRGESKDDWFYRQEGHEPVQ
jgi:hypothetical protein